MPVYMIVDIEVREPTAYAAYVRQVPPLVARYDGRYLARGGQVEVVEGDWTPGRLIVIEFPSFERFHAWFDSPEYQQLAPLRQRSTRSRVIVVEGCGPPV